MSILVAQMKSVWQIRGIEKSIGTISRGLALPSGKAARLDPAQEAPEPDKTRKEPDADGLRPKEAMETAKTHRCKIAQLK